MQQYHDEEWGVPQHDSRELWKCSCSRAFRRDSPGSSF